MKKFIKIILCIAAGCIGMGIAALAIGIVLGKNTFSQDTLVHYMFNLKNTYWNIRDVTEGIKKGVTHWDDVTDEVNWIHDKDQTYEDGDDLSNHMQVDADEVQRLEVDLRHGYLEVNRSEDSQIYVVWNSKKKDSVQASIESGRLLVQDTRQGKDARKDIEIYLSIPAKKEFDDIQVQLDAGELDIDTALSAGHMELKADAGVITAEKLASDQLEAFVGTGEIDISESSFGKAVLDCGVGTIDLEGSICSDAKMECGMGTIDLDLEEDVDSYNYILNCGMGSIEIGDSSYSALSREKRIQNGADATFTLNCGMGSITIE